MATTTTNFGWDIPQSTDLVKDGATAIAALGQDIDTAFVDLKGGTTGQVLAKASNTDLDYTWVAQDDSNAIQNAIVDAKGDLIAASAADTPARLAVGNNGETLVADSSTATGLSYQANFAAGKNKIINGDFGIWQRGTTFTNATVNTFTADRWFFGGSGNNTGSISRQTFTPGTAPVAGYEGKYFFRFDQTTTGITPAIIYRIEDVQTFAGQTVTLSFWVKTSSAITGGIVNAYVEQFFGSGGSGNVATQILNTTNTTTGWTRITASVAVPSIAGKTIGTGSYLQLTIYPKAATVLTMDLWGFQLEAGSVATAFQTATGTIQGELAACQRYYRRFTAGGSASYLGFGSAFSTTKATASFYTGTMRTTPSTLDYSAINVADGVSGYASTAASLVAATSTPDVSNVDFTVASGLTQYRPYYAQANGTTSYVGFSAEL